MKTIKQMLDTLLYPHHANIDLKDMEAMQEYNQGQYFAKLALEHQREFLSKKLPYDVSHLDQRNAMWNFLSAALRGHAQAQYELGMAYYTGHLGLERDYVQAEEWLKRAAACGHVGAQEQLNEIYQLIAFS